MFCSFNRLLHDFSVLRWAVSREVIITVIAFDGKQMASDSIQTDSTSGSVVKLGNCQKLYRMKSGAILGTAGDSDARELIALFDSCETEIDLPSKLSMMMCRTDFEGLLWLPDKTLWSVNVKREEDDLTVWDASVFELRGKEFAVGCGAPYALGALDHGATAVQAVKVAIKRDAKCGGPIQVMTLEAKKPVKKPRPSKKKIISVIEETVEELSSVV